MEKTSNNSSASPSAWAYKNFRFFTYAAFLWPLGGQTQTLLIGWQVFELTKNPLYLGFIGLAEALPALSLALYAGYVVDRTNPLTVYKNVVRLGLLSALLLLIVCGNIFPFSREAKLVCLYSAAVLSGIARGFRMPSVVALVPRLVPREALHISSAWNASSFSIASAVGPAAGGFIYAFFGPAVPYGSIAVLLAFALFLLARIHFEHQSAAPVASSSTYDNLTAGLRYVFSHQLLVAVMTLDMFAVLFGGAVALLPVFAGEILYVGPSGLGILRAASSVGAMTGSILLIRYPARRKSGKVLLGAVTGFGLCMVVFGLSQSFWLSVAALFAGGLFDSASMVIRSAIVQLSAPPEMRGRVGSVNSIFIGVSNQLGEFESGVMATLMGTAPSVVFGGVLTLIVVAIAAVKAPALRKMELSNL